MRDLRLVGVADDGSALLLGDDEGRPYRLAIDEAVGAAVRGDRSRIGQLAIEPGELRPRDIQALVRSGASAEALAAQSGMPLDRVRRYASPVLAERAHVVQRAQVATARLSIRAEGPAPQLLEAVHDRLASAGVDPHLARWDAWRREDGTWTVEVAHPVAAAGPVPEGEGPARARFVLDPGTRTAVADDEPARWLLGEEPEIRAPFVPRLAPAPDGLPEGLAGHKTLVAAADRAPVELTSDDLATDDLAPVLVPEQVAAAGAVRADPDSAAMRAAINQPEAPATTGTPTEQSPAAEGGNSSGRRDRRSERRARRATPRGETGPGGGQPTTSPTRAQGKPPVPSWDEILFGAGRPQG